MATLNGPSKPPSSAPPCLAPLPPLLLLPLARQTFSRCSEAALARCLASCSRVSKCFLSGASYSTHTCRTARLKCSGEARRGGTGPGTTVLVTAAAVVVAEMEDKVTAAALREAARDHESALDAPAHCTIASMLEERKESGDSEERCWPLPPTAAAAAAAPSSASEASHTPLEASSTRENCTAANRGSASDFPAVAAAAPCFLRPFDLPPLPAAAFPGFPTAHATSMSAANAC
mmetsp:Transcript_18841/g.37256  ORF Transcript_18841/g.37256 Transcript_18841/m.37256 type:complete len:233 (+) Transcript_18841:926-1624(+)